MHIIEDELNNQEPSYTSNETNFYSRVVGDEQLIPSIYHQIEDDYEDCTADFFGVLKSNVESYLHLFRNENDLIYAAKAKYQEIVSNILYKILVDKYKLDEELIASNTELPNFLEEALINVYDFFVKKRSYVISSYLHREILVRYNSLPLEEVLKNLKSFIKEILDNTNIGNDESAIDLLTKDMCDSYGIESVRDWLEDYTNDDMIQIYCRPIISNTIYSEDLICKIALALRISYDKSKG